MRVLVRVVICAVLAMLLCSFSSAQARNSCLDCHSGMDVPIGVTREHFAADVHAQKGLGCTDCHGGDANSDDPDRAMSKATGFRGHISRAQIPSLCGNCHSKSAYVRQYDPSLRTDQLAQYGTSRHGKLLAAGDTKVAVCTDCHGLHGILAPTDSRSPVHPLNVAKTCSRCHSDADYMRGRNIPTDQFASYEQSVHQEAMTVRGDLSAPTCTTCHGNHGAVPPGVASVENVCGTCHVFQAQLFDTSPHKAAFSSAGFPGCMTCHSNHKIVRPADQMLGAGPGSVCTNCHEAGTVPLDVATAMEGRITALQGAISASDEILSRAERSGMEVSEAKLQQTQARDALTKARVAVHTFRVGPVDQEVNSGLKTAAATYKAGKNAMAERDYRRKGLGVSVVLIAFVLAGVWMYIREIESNGGPKSS